MRTCSRMRPAASASRSANASGALREPGHSTTSRTPPRISSSTTTRACAVEGLTIRSRVSHGHAVEELQDRGVDGLGSFEEPEVAGVGNLQARAALPGDEQYRLTAAAVFIGQVGHPRDVTSLRLRRDRAALIAWSQTSPDMALSCAGFTRSFDIRAVAAALVDADAFDMWPESNGGCGSYSMASWMTFARPSPPIFAASHSPRSMPADTPAHVTILFFAAPSAATMRSSPTALTPITFRAGSAAQCDVARLPSSNPAAARMIEPEHTDVVHVAV